MALDDADKKTIAELIAAGLKTYDEEAGKKYVTADAAGKMVEQGVKAGIEGLKLPELIGEAVKKAAPAGGADKGADKGAGAGGADKGANGGAADPVVAKLQEQLEELQNKNREADQRAKAAEEASRRQKLEGELRGALTAAGVAPGLMDASMALLPSRKLSDGKPILVHEADGTIKMRVQRKGYVDTVPVVDGVKDWLATDEGKNYLPATGKQGDGAGAGNPNRSQSNTTIPQKDGRIDWAALGNVNLSGVLGPR